MKRNAAEHEPLVKARKESTGSLGCSKNTTRIINARTYGKKYCKTSTMVDVASITVSVLSLVTAIAVAVATGVLQLYSEDRKARRETERLLKKYRDPLLLGECRGSAVQFFFCKVQKFTPIASSCTRSSIKNIQHNREQCPRIPARLFGLSRLLDSLHRFLIWPISLLDPHSANAGSVRVFCYGR
jgi:hypothetical protein